MLPEPVTRAVTAFSHWSRQIAGTSWRSPSRWGLLLVLLAFALLGWDWIRLSSLASNRYTGQGWKFTTRVYADWIELREGERVGETTVRRALERADYKQSRGRPANPGEFRQRGSIYEIWLRPFVYPDRVEHGAPVLVEVRDGRVADLGDGFTKPKPRGLVRLDPELLAEFSDRDRERRSWTPLGSIPRNVALAVVAGEDRRFFHHWGLDLLGITRATVRNARARAVVEGGSTISQQLVKNLFLSHERSVLRKLHEAVLALMVELRYSKEQILEFYLNQIYLGQRGSWSLCGVEEAALYYFNKHVNELSLGESALLAGIIPAPNRFSPYRDPELAIERRNEVLQDMVDCGFISKGEAGRVRAVPLRFAPNPAPTTKAPYFVDYVRETLARDIPEAQLLTRGLLVFTTLDSRAQEAAERAVRDGAREADWRSPSGGAEKNPAQAALVAIEPSSGALRALVGGRDYGTSPFDRAVDSRRQPGSAFKPFVYIAAINTAFDGRKRPLTAATMLADQPDSFPTPYGPWAPKNYEDTYLGQVTAARALARSLNVATVRLALEVGLPKVIEVARELGIEGQLRPVASLALGTSEVTPLEMTTAYAAIANHGLLVKPVAVRSVIDREGDLLWTPHRDARRALRAEIAYMATLLLEGPILYGTANSVRSEYGFMAPAAGKTGTTDDENDAWFVGFTPQLCAGVWVGCDRDRRLGLTGTQAAVPIWARFMSKALAESSATDFQAPPGLVEVWIDGDTGYRAGADCPHVMREAFVPRTEPREVCPIFHAPELPDSLPSDSTGLDLTPPSEFQSDEGL